MEEITIEERENHVLEFLYREGYLTTKSIVRYLKGLGERGSSIENTRKMLQRLSRQYIDFKELLGGEHVYHLTDKGLTHLGRNHEVAAFNNKLKRINLRCIGHYFLTRRLEEVLTQNIEQSGHIAESINEFNDEHLKLQVKLKDKGIKSDAEVKISSRDGFEFLSLRVEVDMGTEAISTVLKKFDTYLLFLSSNINIYATYPVYILFVTSADRIITIAKKLNRHKIAPYLLFLPIERLNTFSIELKHQESLDNGKITGDLRKEFKKNKRQLSSQATIMIQEKGKEWVLKEGESRYIVKQEKDYLSISDNTNLFSSKVIMNSQGAYLSLLSIVAEREPLLKLKDALQVGIESHPYYKIVIHTRFSTPHHDPFFPLLIYANNRQLLWAPHGYLRVYKNSPAGQSQQVLFALIFCTTKVTSHILENIMPYEVFLTQKEAYLSRVCTLPMYYGLFIIAKDEAQITELNLIIKGLKIHERTRIILQSDCESNIIWEKLVWRTPNGACLSLLKHS